MQKKVSKKKKFLYFIKNFIQLYVILYIIFSLISYFFKGVFPMAGQDASSLAAASAGVTLVHWLNAFYPKKRSSESNEHNKSLKDYIRKYVIEGSTFNKFMIIVYSFTIFIILFFMIALSL